MILEVFSNLNDSMILCFKEDFYLSQHLPKLLKLSKSEALL